MLDAIGAARDARKRAVGEIHIGHVLDILQRNAGKRRPRIHIARERITAREGDSRIVHRAGRHKFEAPAAEVHVVELVAAGREVYLVALLKNGIVKGIVGACFGAVAVRPGRGVHVGVAADVDVPRDRIRPDGVRDDALQDAFAARALEVVERTRRLERAGGAGREVG